MKGWQLATLGVGLVLIIVVAMRGTAKSAAVSKATSGPSTSNDLFAAAGSLFGGLLSSKPSAPSALPSAIGPSSSQFEGGAYADPTSQRVLSTFDRSNSTETGGFMFTDDRGNFIAG